VQSGGYTCRAFAGGREFLAEMIGLEPGCVLLDFQMPALSGLEILSELRRMEIGWPVVMITGHGHVGVGMTALGHGAFGFLEKPFKKAMLMRILNRAFLSGKIGAQTPAADL
jgi:two-component system response regulator FixJ